jgi:adenine-specific DNA methylase
MTEEDNSERSEERKSVAIEGKLPLKAVGIENLKEANPQHMPPHRYLHPWFARRPTPGARLAVLASVLPADVEPDELLNWMQIGPSEGTGGESIVDYVARKKSQEDERTGTLQDHYSYPRPFTRSPSKNQREEIHDLLLDQWEGELPTILDPTAGGGVIPFESLRYDLPTIANELNAVPSLILKTMNEYAPKVGSLKSDLNRWSDEIDKIASEQLKEYFPSKNDRQTPSHYACTYTVTCPDCGFEIPLVKKWWLQKQSATKGIAARPQLNHENKSIEYDCVRLPDDVEKSEFDPQKGPYSRSGADCLNCPVVLESDNIQEAFKEGEYRSTIYAVKYVSDSSSSGWRAPTKIDHDACKKASNRVDTDFTLQSLLSTKRYDGDIHERALIYGVSEWRDAFTDRQLISHYEYLQAFHDVEEQIRQEHDEIEANAILTILSLISSKAIDRNTRFAPLDTGKGYPANAVGGKQFGLQWSFVDNNLCAGNQSWKDNFERVRDSYEEMVTYLEDIDNPDSTVLVGDAADLEIESESIQAVVIDPPYYDSIIYSEMSDIFYVWLKEYLGESFPEMFPDDLSNKEDEAVANVAEYDHIADGSKSKKDFAAEDYEDKMAEIFQELHRVLEPGGVMTVMFTHKESSAWDTLTKSLIRSGFTVTSTHPITSEMPQRTDTRGGGSADSTLLLTGRKPVDSSTSTGEKVPTLWSDVRADTRTVAKEAARDLLDSGLSLTKTDVIISAFGPTLKVYADAYPVVDDRDEEVPPRRALEEAREAVTRVLVEEYLEGEGLGDLDDITEWYILSWLVHESDTFHYDDGHQLGLGVGVDIDDIKRSTKIWGKKRGDIQLKTHEERVQDITLPPEERSNRTPVDPEALSYTIALDAVHAAMHIYEKQGEDVAIDWLKERNFDTDAGFKATLKALLQVLPKNSSEWEAARDLALGRTHDALALEFTPTDFTAAAEDRLEQSELGDHES